MNQKLSRKSVPYQLRDASAFDYQIYFTDDFPLGLRGPRTPVHLFPAHAVAIGSAGVFGRFVHQPFTEQLTMCQIPTLNLGVSGARPLHFQLEHAVSSAISGADVVIAEFMSARGYPTCFYEPTTEWGNTGTFVGADGDRTADVFVDRAWTLAMQQLPEETLQKEVERSRELYYEDYCRVIDNISSKIVFLWISQRSPDYTPENKSFITYSGWFPHFVNEELRDRLLKYARESKGADNVKLVEVVSNDGLPAPLYERHTGAPATFLSRKNDKPSVNIYYPSQTMHDEAAVKLRDALIGWWA